MTEVLDLPTLFLALAVIVLFGFFFWHVAHLFWRSTRHISDLFDASSQRGRNRPAYQPRHGPPLTWKQILRRAVQAFLILALLGLVWLRFRGL